MPNSGVRHGFLTLLVALLLGAMMLPAMAAAQDTQTRDYDDIAGRLDLQADPEIYPAEDDWRARAGVEEVRQQESDWARNVPWGRVFQIVIWGLAAALLATIIYLVWRYGAAIQVGLSANAEEGRTDAGEAVSGPVLSAEPKALSIEDVLAMDDAARALGALQRLVLEAALSAMNASLQRSDTARAVLRRLPRDWKHYLPVADLVRRAERVRFAGDEIDRTGLEAAVESVRPVLQQSGRVA